MLNSSGGQKPSSNFTQKCSLFSQYLKENGSFGDISLDMTASLQSKGLETPRQQQPTTTTTMMNLLPILENSSAEDYQSKQSVMEETIKKSTYGSASHDQQMTIFYAGKVFVFNDFPAEKAKQIMALAGKFGSTTAATTTTASASEKVDSGKPAAFATHDLNIASAGGGGSSGNIMNASREALLHHHHHQHQHQHQHQNQYRQFRKASLHRFFDKRKDRIAARAPYKANTNSPSSMDAAAASASAPYKPEPSKPWLDLEVQTD